MDKGVQQLFAEPFLFIYDDVSVKTVKNERSFETDII